MAFKKSYRNSAFNGNSQNTREARIKSDLRIIEAQAKKNNEGKKRSVIRYSHNYKWFGFSNKVEDSIRDYRIAAKCLDLTELRYKCIAPDPDYDDCCLCFETTESDIEARLKTHPKLKDFVLENCFTLVDFIFMEITEKIYNLSRFFDLVEFLDLEGEESDAIPIDDVIKSLD